MNSKWQTILLAILAAGLTACSEQTSPEKAITEEEYFLTEKLETIKKAETVEKMIQDAATQQRRNIKEQGG
ncbi:MAG: hypothetical protein L3J84_06410 [Gammaproteobacteria bacterium]|nr:hypothetical protein [Gammaproteobacteria bacterium]